MAINEFLKKIIKTLRYYINSVLFQLRFLRYQIWAVKLIQPIFVVGCSRAGTTLVYKTLSESKYLGSLQKETHDFWASLHPPEQRNWDSHEIPEEMACKDDRNNVSRFFYTQTGKLKIVDKNNQNGLSISFLYKLFPDAHFIYIKRNPGDNINSLILGWNKADEFATWSDDLPEKINIEKGNNQRWCFFLAEGWRQYKDANIEEVCAFQYKTMNEAILVAKQNVLDNHWHEVNYEMLIDDPVNEFRKIFHGCGLPFDSDLIQHCEDVLDKPYNIFSEIKVNKWKDGSNRKKISLILPIIKDVAEKMGY